MGGLHASDPMWTAGSELQFRGEKWTCSGLLGAVRPDASLPGAAKLMQSLMQLLMQITTALYLAITLSSFDASSLFQTFNPKNDGLRCFLFSYKNTLNKCPSVCPCGSATMMVLDQNGFSAFGQNGAIWIRVRDWRPMWTDLENGRYLAHILSCVAVLIFQLCSFCSILIQIQVTSYP